MDSVVQNITSFQIAAPLRNESGGMYDKWEKRKKIFFNVRKNKIESELDCYFWTHAVINGLKLG